LDVRLQQLQTHQVLPDEQIILKAFQTAVEQQIEQGAYVGKKYLESSGGVVDTAMWTDPLLKPFKPPAEGSPEGLREGGGFDGIDRTGVTSSFEEIDLQFDAVQVSSEECGVLMPEILSGIPCVQHTADPSFMKDELSEDPLSDQAQKPRYVEQAFEM
jgi:hypothetical protein